MLRSLDWRGASPWRHSRSSARRRGRLTPVLETFTHATFEPHVGESFLLQAGQEAAVEVVLVDASLLPALTRPETRAPFSIVFRGPSGAILPQAIYRLDHAAIGTFDVFLVPIAEDAGGVRYEAVFT